MTHSPYLLIKRIVLRGVTKNYEAHFEQGLNIIWGDMDTGKSSILNLIDYCFGGSNSALRYAEISSNTRVVFLEVDLNSTVVTIERDLIEPKGPVRVYSGRYDEVGSLFPRFMSTSPSEQMRDGWLSDFILECLGIPRVSIKESKKEDANSDRLSLRDLMKLLYLKQTRVGSDNLLDHANYPVFNKNVEVQKFVFNVHNELVTQLKNELAAELKERNALASEREIVRKFLASINVQVDGKASVEAAIEQKQARAQTIEDDIKTLKENFTLTSRLAVEMKKIISELKQQLETRSDDIATAERKHNNYIKLRETYKVDLEGVLASRFARKSMGNLQANIKPIACPLCASQIKISSVCVDERTIEIEIKSLRNRISGIEEAIANIWEQRKLLLQEQDEIANELERRIKNFDQENAADISGLVQSIEAMERSRLDAQMELAELQRVVSINRRFSDIDHSLSNKAATIDSLRRAITSAEEGLVDFDNVIEKLSQLLIVYMQKSGLKNVTDIFVDKKFTPHVRGISYYETPSGGVRTITSIGSFLIRLLYLLEKGGNLPTFLMIDTPGQNIGRYKRDEDSEATDPAVYEKIYEQIAGVIEYAESKNKISQVIIVDNDLPLFLQKNRGFHLVKRFSKDSPEFERGLINDVGDQ